jgi:VWFA-related protein
MIPACILAQSNPASPVPQSQAPASQAAPANAPNAAPTVLRANANLVLIDVVVTDHGNPVHGLDRTRFHISEDGREQAITTFDEHQPSPALANATTQPALPPHTYTNIPAFPPSPAVNVLLLDGLNTPMPNQMQVRRQMLDYMGKIEPGTSLAIFTLASRLRMVEGFTTDAAQLARALKDSKSGPQASVMLDPQSDQALDASIGDIASMSAGLASAGGGDNAISEMQQFQADITAFQTDQRVRMTLDAMQQLARYLSGVPGRKNLIWFSGSFPIALDPDDTLQNPFEGMRNYTDDIRETNELLSSARVAVYPVDARGLMTLLTADASSIASTNLMSAPVTGGRGGSRSTATANKPSVAKDDAAFMKQTMQEQGSMQQIAVETGGHAYLNTNGLKEAVASAVANGSSYYTVGYSPAGKPFDGQFRKIQLRVDNGEYKLAYRNGYYADPIDKPSAHNPRATSLIMAATLHGAPPSTQIPFQARILAATDPLLQDAKLPEGPAGEATATLKGPLHRVIAEIKVDPRQLDYEQSPDGSQRAKVEFTIVGFDADGRRLNYQDRGFQVNPTPEQYARALATGISIRMALDLPVGRAWLRIAVHDLNADRAGSLEALVPPG